MNFDTLRESYLAGDISHDALLDALDPLMLSCSHDVIEEIEEWFCSTFSSLQLRDDILSHDSDTLSSLPKKTRIQGLYTIERILLSSPCFCWYAVSRGQSVYHIAILRPDLWGEDYEEAFLREKTISTVLNDGVYSCIHFQYARMTLEE